MSRPDDIPQDVWDTAERWFDVALSKEQQTKHRPAVDAISRAILEERERNVRAARTTVQNWLMATFGEVPDNLRALPDAVADAIHISHAGSQPSSQSESPLKIDGKDPVTGNVMRC